MKKKIGVSYWLTKGVDATGKINRKSNMREYFCNKSKESIVRQWLLYKAL